MVRRATWDIIEMNTYREIMLTSKYADIIHNFPNAKISHFGLISTHYTISVKTCGTF